MCPYQLIDLDGEYPQGLHRVCELLRFSLWRCAVSAITIQYSHAPLVGSTRMRCSTLRYLIDTLDREPGSRSPCPAGSLEDDA